MNSGKLCDRQRESFDRRELIVDCTRGAGRLRRCVNSRGLDHGAHTCPRDELAGDHDGDRPYDDKPDEAPAKQPLEGQGFLGSRMRSMYHQHVRAIPPEILRDRGDPSSLNFENLF